MCGDLLLIYEFLIGCGRERILHILSLKEIVGVAGGNLACLLDHLVFLVAYCLCSLLLVADHPQVVVGDVLVLLSKLGADGVVVRLLHWVQVAQVVHI